MKKKEKEIDEIKEEECRCQEGAECTCGDECNCESDCDCMNGGECTCGDECNCESECSCGDHCECGDNCECDDECDCNDDECSCCCCSEEERGCGCGECDCEEEEIDRLQNLVIELNEKTQYAQAELVNYRKRKDEEVSNMLKYANKDLVLELIPVLDNFERAIKLAKSDDEKLNSFLEGFKMLYSHIVDTLKQFGVEEIEALGHEFDPNLHLALITDKDENKENDTVLEVLLKGYTLKGKMIRPASVKVNKID